jgi:carbamate kinase
MAVLTNIERVCINFGKPDQKEIERMTVSEAQAWFDEGQFPPGTMGPKIEGALNFLRAAQKPDARVVIGPLFKAADTVAGKAGTTITKN